MIDQQIINWGFTALSGLIGFLLNSIWQAVKDLQKDDAKLVEKVNAVEVLVAGNYVRKTELAELSRALFEKLDRIEGKVDHKADK